MHACGARAEARLVDNATILLSAPAPPPLALTVVDTPPLDTAARPAAPWPDSSRPADSASSGFAGLLPEPAAARPRGDAAEGSAFDVCHVGVVLRAVLLVQCVLALGTMYAASTFAGWVLVFARGSIVSLWAVLLWLIASCAAKGLLSRLAVPAQWAAAVSLGALCTAASGVLLVASGLGDAAWPLDLAPIASGAAIAAALFYWLRLRARARVPADATARLAELQSRIRPHFLFNTLNTAVTLVRVDPARAEAVLEDLAELFRVALSEARDAVSLADEVELARRYLDIEQVRFGERLQVAWEIDPQSFGARVPPLLLQPLVENAVRHGIEPAPAGGTIRVRVRVRRGHAVIDIVNTLGEAPSAPGHGMALHNVRERLRLMHDVAAQFEARRDGDVYRVQIVVPLPA
jgi:two-component system, LytTR family, sensor histidine kinase AlgZ